MYELDSGIGADGALAAGDNAVLTPMPGKVIKVMVSNGEAITKGQPLLILEAMKMEHTIVAPCDGEIEAVMFEAGDLVEDGKVLVNINNE